MPESKEELKNFLMKVKEESEKVGLKLNIQKTRIMASGLIVSWQIDGETWKQWLTLLVGAPKSLQMKLKDPYSLEKSYDQTSKHIKKQRHYFANKGPSRQGYGFSSSNVWMWELDYKESWEVKNWFFWTVVLGKTLESPLDCKKIQPVHPKGNQSWIFIGRTDAETETPVLWPPHAKSWLTGKDPDAGRDWGQKKGTTEDEMAGWHHLLDGHEFEQTLEVGDGQGGLACWDSWGCKELDMTERLNWTELIGKHRAEGRKYRRTHLWYMTKDRLPEQDLRGKYQDEK